MNLPDLDSSLASVRGGRREGVGAGPAGASPCHPHRSRTCCLPRSPPGPWRLRTAPIQVSPAPAPLPAPAWPCLRPLTTPPHPTGKQLVHYTAQPLLLLDPDAVDTGSSELPVLFELGEGSCFSQGEDYSDDPTISLLTGSEPPKAKDPAVS